MFKGPIIHVDGPILTALAIHIPETALTLLGSILLEAFTHSDSKMTGVILEGFYHPDDSIR